MQSRPIFPQEIFDLILDEIPYVPSADSYLDHRETAPVLLNCSLTCSSFRKNAQKRLFRDVSISFPISEYYSSYDSKVLYQTLMTNERLRNFVTRLRIVLRPNPPTSCVFFPSFPNLAHLNVTGDNLEEPLDWTWTLSSDWETSKVEIFKIMHVPTLRTLKICNIFEFPLGVLLTCGQVQELYVDMSSVSNSNKIDSDLLPILPRQQAYLESLDFSYYSFPLLLKALRSNPSSPLSIARLQRLRLSIFDHETEEAVHEVLLITARSLKHLEICFEPGFEMCWETLNLPDPSILRHLTFSMAEWEDYWNMQSFLEQIPEANSNLAGILLYLHSDCAEPEDTWEQLDELLARARQFRCLEVRVGYEWKELVDVLPRLLPRLAGSGQLVITHEPNYCSNPMPVLGF